MNRDKTQNIETASFSLVEFRCICGNAFEIDSKAGGQCSSCSRNVTPAMLSDNLSVTFQLPKPSTTLGQTAVVDRQTSMPVASLAARELPQGTRLGHFEVVSRLGSGGMAQVYRALDHSLQRYVAVKVLKSKAVAGKSESDGEVNRLMQEAVAQARLPHPNVVPIYYVGRHDGSLFLAMELVAGQTLQQRMAQHDCQFHEIVSTAAQIADALRYARELDLIHGDIKPSNVLVQNNGVVKLSDFGMARSASSDDGTPVGGTPNYLAPELLTGGKPTVQSDIYALGVTAYEMTFGSLPVSLSGTTMDEWASSHQSSKLRFPKAWPESIPEMWGKILSRMLAKEPAERYQDYASLQADLYRVFPSSSPPARWLPRIIAGMIDFSIVMFVMLSVSMVGSLVLSILSGWAFNGFGHFWESNGMPENAPWYLNAGFLFLEIFFHACLFLPILGHTLLVGSWRTSIGRSLLHVAIVNRYGLRPVRRLSISREFFRLLFAWIVPVVFLFGSGFVGSILTIVCLCAVLVFTIVNTAMLVITPTGKTLHDRWFHTSAVLATG